MDSILFTSKHNREASGWAQNSDKPHRQTKRISFNLSMMKQNKGPVNILKKYCVIKKQGRGKRKQHLHVSTTHM